MNYLRRLTKNDWIPERLGYRLESTMKANRIKPVNGEVTDTLVYVRNDLIDLPELDVSW
jgi:hypothetical protein